VKTGFIKFWLPVYFYAGVIFILSSIPQPAPAVEIPHLDKLLHVFEYAILGFLLIRALRNSDFQLTKIACQILAITFTAIYGIIDEIHQYYVPSRAACIYDVFFDTIGACVGVVFYSLKVRN